MGISIQPRDPGQWSIDQGLTGNSQADYQGINWGGPNPLGNPAFMGNTNTGNEFGGWPPGTPSQWGTYDMPIQQPTMFNMQPYVETFNTGWPVQMNPAYNIDNITNVDQTLMQRLFSQWLTGGTSPFGPGAPQNGNE